MEFAYDTALDEAGGEDTTKGPWTQEEDNVLRALVINSGARNWSKVAECIPGRSGKSCRLRWLNQLSPSVRGGPFTPDEDAVILWAQLQYGNKWAAIAKHLPGRTDNHIKNRWNCTLKKRYSQLMNQLTADLNPGTLSMADIAAVMAQHGVAATRSSGTGPRGAGGPCAGGLAGLGSGPLGPAAQLFPGGPGPQVPFSAGPPIGQIGSGLPGALPLALQEMGGGLGLGGLGTAAGVLPPGMKQPLALPMSTGGLAALSPRSRALLASLDQERQAQAEQGTNAGGLGLYGADGTEAQQEHARGVKRARAPKGASSEEHGSEEGEDSAAVVLKQLAVRCSRELPRPSAFKGRHSKEDDEDDEDCTDTENGDEDDEEEDDDEEMESRRRRGRGKAAAPPLAGDADGGGRTEPQGLGLCRNVAGGSRMGGTGQPTAGSFEGGPRGAAAGGGGDAAVQPSTTAACASGAQGDTPPVCGYGSVLLGLPENLMQLSSTMRVVLSAGNLPAAQALVSKLEELAYSVLMQRAAYNLASEGGSSEQQQPRHQQQRHQQQAQLEQLQQQQVQQQIQQQQQVAALNSIVNGGVDPQVLAQILLLTQGPIV